MDGTGLEFSGRNLTARGPLGVVFESISLHVPAGGLAAVVGSGGSGRTSLLLALAGRLSLVAGRLSVGDLDLPKQAKQVQQQVALARAEPAYPLDARLRVAELIAERKLIGGRGFTSSSLRDSLDLLQIDPPRDLYLAQLPAVQQTLLAVALALAEGPGAVVVDDAEQGCGEDDAEWLWHRLSTVAAAGCTVLTSATGPPPIVNDEVETVIIELPHPALRDALLPRTEEDPP